MRGISSRITIIVTRRYARTSNRDRYSSTLSDIYFARMFVYRAINSTNAKCGKTDVSRLNLNAKIAVRVRHTYWITLETPFPVRRPFKLVSVRDTLYTLSAIKIKRLYKINKCTA